MLLLILILGNNSLNFKPKNAYTICGHVYKLFFAIFLQIFVPFIEIPVMSARLRHHLKTHENGMELAFERCKGWSNFISPSSISFILVWSKYANQLIAFVRNRLELETSHLRNCLKLAEQMRANISEPNYVHKYIYTIIEIY